MNDAQGSRLEFFCLRRGTFLHRPPIQLDRHRRRPHDTPPGDNQGDDLDPSASSPPTGSPRASCSPDTAYQRRSGRGDLAIGKVGREELPYLFWRRLGCDEIPGECTSRAQPDTLSPVSQGLPCLLLLWLWFVLLLYVVPAHPFTHPHCRRTVHGRSGKSRDPGDVGDLSSPPPASRGSRPPVVGDLPPPAASTTAPLLSLAACHRLTGGDPLGPDFGLVLGNRGEDAGMEPTSRGCQGEAILQRNEIHLPLPQFLERAGTAPWSSAPVDPAARRRCARPCPARRSSSSFSMPGRSIVLPVNLSLYHCNLPVVGRRPPLQVGKLGGVVLLLAGHPDVDGGVFRGHDRKMSFLLGSFQVSVVVSPLLSVIRRAFLEDTDLLHVRPARQPSCPSKRKRLWDSRASFSR